MTKRFFISVLVFSIISTRSLGTLTTLRRQNFAYADCRRIAYPSKNIKTRKQFKHFLKNENLRTDRHKNVE